MVRNSTQDVESGASSTRNKRKTSLPLIIALAVALVAAIVFMVVFVIYQNKHAAAQADLELKKKLLAAAEAEIEAGKKRLGGMTSLAEELLDTKTTPVPGMEPVLMKRTEVWGKDFEPDKENEFNIMQLNMLADKYCGLFDDPMNPEIDENKYAMLPQNQHILYWRYRISLIVAEIIANKADIVTIQGNDHPEAIEKALNVRAKVKEEDDSKQTQDDIWKCEYFARTKSPNKKYLPSDKHKEDGSTICWNVTIFIQDKEFTKRAAYENQELTNLDGSTSKIDSGDVYVAVKLTHKEKKKTLIVVTTQLASEKTLEGEAIRMHQMKELMKKMKEWKKDDTAIIVAADLNAFPIVEDPQKAGVRNTAPKGDYILENANLEGKFYCQVEGESDITAVEVKDNLFTLMKDNKVVRSNYIKNEQDRFTMVFDKEKLILKKNSKMYKWIGPKKTIVCQKFVDPKPAKVAALTFDLLPNLGGKTFHDSFGQKYVIDKYDESKPGSIDMKIGENKWTITKGSGSLSPNKLIAKPDEGSGQCTLTSSDQKYEWYCTDLARKNNFKMVWSQKRNDYNFNYPLVYDYITAPGKAIDPKVITDLKADIIALNDNGLGSVVEHASTNHYTNVTSAVDKIFSMDQEDQDYSKTMELLSSQKQLYTNEPEQTFWKNDIRYTKNYIFATNELTPVSYLSYPWSDKKTNDKIERVGGFLDSNYPSDNMSIMTKFRFA